MSISLVNPGEGQRAWRKKTLMYYLVSSGCVTAHSEKVIFGANSGKERMSQADLGRKSVLGREKSKDTRGRGCLVFKRHFPVGKPTGSH